MVHSYLVMKKKPLYSVFKFLNSLASGAPAKALRPFSIAPTYNTDSLADFFSHQLRYIHLPTLAKGQIL